MLQKSLHSIIPRLALLSAFCVFIEVFRMIFSLHITYIFMPYNLFLAWVPLWLAMYLKDETRPVHLFIYLSVWLLFFPNAPYMITDLLHLRPLPHCPFWYDVILFYSYAFTGLMVGIISALIVFKKMKTLVTPWRARVFMLMVMMVSGYGIYMGRFLQFNSWDLLTNPLQIISMTISRFIHPTVYARTYGVTLMTGALLSLVFFIFESIVVTD